MHVEKTITDQITDILKLVMTAGGLLLMWNMSGTLSSIQTEMKGMNEIIKRHDSRITYLERSIHYGQD